jgi:DNA polymerase (family 10)
MRYGILVARKGGVSATNCLNTKSLKEISAFFTNRKKIN